MAEMKCQKNGRFLGNSLCNFMKKLMKTEIRKVLQAWAGFISQNEHCQGHSVLGIVMPFAKRPSEVDRLLRGLKGEQRMKSIIQMNQNESNVLGSVLKNSDTFVQPRHAAPFNAEALQQFHVTLAGSIKSVTTSDSLLGIGETATITLTMSHLSSTLNNGKIQATNGTATIIGSTIGSGNGNDVYKILLTPSPGSSAASMDLSFKGAGEYSDGGSPNGIIFREAIDMVAPNAPTNLDLAAADDKGASNTDNITNQTTQLTITGNAEANATVELFNGSFSLGKVTTNALGVFNTDISLSGSNTAYNITAKAIDAAGNVSGVSVPLSITVDTVNPDTPTISLDNITANNVLGTAEALGMVTLTGNATNVVVGDIVTVMINGAKYSATVASGGGFSILVPGADLAVDVDHQIQASVTTYDLAGNASIGSADKLFVLNTAPDVTAPLLFNTTEGHQAFSTDLLANATDVDGQVLSVSAVTFSVDGQAISGLPAGVALNGSQLSVNPTDRAFDSLAVGQSKTIQVNYTISDGEGGFTSASETITITGSNDVATVSSANITVLESNAASTLNASGQLVITDVDAGDLSVRAQDVKANYGNFHINTDGSWTYTGNGAHDELKAGQQVSDSITVTSLDGTGTGVITVTIQGSNDIASVTSAAVYVTEGNTSAALNAAGQLTISDIDNGEALLQAKDVTGLYGTFHVNADGSWTYTGNGAHDELKTGQKVSDSITVTSLDGSATGNITVNITGTNDLTTIVSAVSAISEGNTATALSTTGKLLITDADSGESLVVAKDLAGAYGTFHVNADGSWTYIGNGTMTS